MVSIKYTRLVNEINNNNIYVRWVKNKIPISFLKQQVFLLSVIACSIALLIVTTFFTSDADYEQVSESEVDIKYGVVVDCGSSGTRAHIFKWRKLGNQQSNIRIEMLRDNQKKPVNKHITPGLSTFRDKPDNASEYMEPIMDFISSSIPYDSHLNTPVYFMATAGMRLLSDLEQKGILSDITRDLRAKYDFPKIRTRVITGQYEGAYSWMSVNLNRFYNSTTSPSIGIIEVGGASVQVTYELDGDTERTIMNRLEDNGVTDMFRNELIELKLPKNMSVKLFATSFLGLGVNKAREFAIDFLVRDYFNGTGQLGRNGTDHNNFSITLLDPCLNEDSNEEVLRPIEVMSSVHKSLGFAMKDQNDTFKVVLNGSGDFLNCLVLLERVVKAIRSEGLNCDSSRKVCPMALLGTEFIPFAKHHFVGLSEMFFTTNEIMDLAGPFNRSRILHATRDICSAKYRLLQLKSQGLVSYEDRVLYECFKASWLLTILHSSAFKMPPHYNGFSTIDRLDGQEIDWTMGAMLWEILIHPQEF